jgi:hypothetical protein
MKLFFDRQPLTSLDEAIRFYKYVEFASPTRSTIPLLSLLKHGGEIWQSVLSHLGLEGHSVETHLELSVPPPQGIGSASRTDVMLIDGDRAVAIEAKWTEPRYEEVGVWLNQGADPKNRVEVMRGWLSLLQNHASKKLELDDFTSAVYQMVHRAASACAIGKLPTFMCIQFCPLPRGSRVSSNLKNDLRYLHFLLGSPDAFPFWLARVEARFNSEFECFTELPKGDLNTCETIRSAFRKSSLLSLTKISFLPIRGANCP